MRSRSHAVVERPRAHLSVIFHIVIALSAILLSLSARAQDFRPTGEVPVNFNCGNGNSLISDSATPRRTLRVEARASPYRRSALVSQLLWE